MTALSGASWTCPACSRRVPGHVSQCRCGRVRREADTATPAVPTQSHSVFMAKMAVAVVVAAAAMAGAVFYARSTPAPAPVATSPRKPSAELPPAIVARAVAEANGLAPDAASPSSARCPSCRRRRAPNRGSPGLLSRPPRHPPRPRPARACRSRISSPASALRLSSSKPRRGAAAASSSGRTRSSPTRTSPGRT